MKQIFLVAGLFLLLMQPVTAQNDSSQPVRKSGVERKLIEIKKIVTLSPAQEQTLMTAYAINQQKGDSILFEVDDPVQAVILKYQADKQLQETLMAILTEQQQIQYHTVTGTPDVMAKTEARVQILRESGQYSEQELAQKQQEIFDYLMEEKIVYLRDKFDIARQKKNIQKLKKTQPASLHENMPYERLEVVKKMLTLTPAQERALKTAYGTYWQRNDSIRTQVTDPKQTVALKYQVEKQLHEMLMATLTEEQRIHYLTITGAPDATAKTEAKVQLLRESGQYSEEELAQKQQEIFDYLMAEKIVYLRDKYNIAKQKDNIQKLKKSQPASLRESNSRENLKASGRVNNGKVKW